MSPLPRVRPERVWGVVVKEFHQTVRDPRLLRLILLAPLVQLVLFGYAVSTDLEEIPTFVVDHSRSQASRRLVDTFTASGYFRVTGRSQDPDRMVRALDRGDAVIGLQVPPDFARDLGGGGAPADVQLVLDGTNSNTASVARTYARRILSGYGEAAAAGRPDPPVELRSRAWFNPTLDSRHYNVPAVAGSLILLVCMMLTALAVVREREIGTLDQLRVSPLRPTELMLGKAIPFGLIGLLDLALVTAAALLWFGVPFRGSGAVFLLGSVLYLLPSLGLGLFVSTISGTQQQAFMGGFLVIMPAILLSGFMFPIASMPEPVQWLTLLNPFRHYLDVVRGVFLRGTGLGTLWPQNLTLLGLGGAVMAAAVDRFRRQAGEA